MSASFLFWLWIANLASLLGQALNAEVALSRDYPQAPTGIAP